MFVTWCLCLPWYIFLVEKGARLRNWFRMPVTLDQAELVLVTATRNEEKMVVNAGNVLNLWLSLLGKCSSGAVIHEETVPVITTTDGMRYFEFECKRFVYHSAHSSFEQAAVVVGPSLQDIHDSAIKGVSQAEWQDRNNKLGPNKIPFAVSPILTLISEELFSYFYLYQLVMYVVWFWFSYLLVAMVLFSVVCISAAANIYIKRSHQVCNTHHLLPLVLFCSFLLLISFLLMLLLILTSIDSTTLDLNTTNESFL